MEVPLNSLQSDLPIAKLVFGQTASGTMTHVSEVSLGAKCLCFCPKCKQPLEAKKGPIKQHHFAHASRSNCKNATETALHKMAKQIIKEQGEIWLPAYSNTIEDARLDAMKEPLLCRYSNCSVEEDQGQVRPDLIIRLKGRLLLVEIFVTHQCDEQKIEILRKLGNSAIEIDLSKIPRDIDFKQLKELVIEKAPRNWIFNAKGEELQKIITEERVIEKWDKIKALNEQTTKLSKAYERPLASFSPSKTKVKPLSLEADFENFLGQNLDGNQCFHVQPEDWQHAIVKTILALPDYSEGLTSKSLFGELKRRKLIKPEFVYVEFELVEALTHRIKEFQTPFKTLVAFLDGLANDGLLARSKNGSYSVSTSLRRRFASNELKFREAQNASDIIAEKFKLIATLFDSADLTSFNFEDFQKTFLGDYEGTLADAIFDEISSTKSILHKLESIEKMLFNGGAICADTLDLPIIEAMTRRKSQIDKFEFEKELERQNAIMLVATRRVETITQEAYQKLSDPDVWLNSQFGELLSPKETARSNEAGLNIARGYLFKEEKRLKLLKEQLNREQSFRHQIRAYAESRIDDPVRVKAFLNASYRFTNWCKVIDYCIGKVQLEDCKMQADKVAKNNRRVT